MKSSVFFLIVCLSFICNYAISQPVAQKYGTHTRFNELTKSEELYPLEDETKVDEWRKELGLEPLADYLAKLNIKYQPKQK